jgi:hypothetical protein
MKEVEAAVVCLWVLYILAFSSGNEEKDNWPRGQKVNTLPSQTEMTTQLSLLVNSTTYNK